MVDGGRHFACFLKYVYNNMINTVVVYMYTRGRARQNWQLRLKLPNNTEVFLQKKTGVFSLTFFINNAYI